MNWLSSAVIVIAILVLRILRNRTRDVPLFAKRLSGVGAVGFAATVVSWVLVKPAPESGLNTLFITMMVVMLMTSIIGLAVKVQHRAAVMRATRR